MGILSKYLVSNGLVNFLKKVTLGGMVSIAGGIGFMAMKVVPGLSDAVVKYGSEGVAKLGVEHLVKVTPALAVTLGTLAPACLAFWASYRTLYGVPFSTNVFSTRVILSLIQDQYFVLTLLRALDKFGFQFQNGQVDDMHLKHREKQLRVIKQELAVVEKMSLKDEKNLGLLTIRAYLAQLVEGYSLRCWPSPLYMIYPGIYPINQMFGCHLSIADILNKQQINNLSDLNVYIERIEHSPYFVNGLLEDLKEREAAGIFPPVYVYDACLNQITNKILNKLEGVPEDYFINKKVAQDLKVMVEKGVIKQDQVAKLLKRVDDALEAYFFPAHKRLERYLLKSKQDTLHVKGDGIWRSPGGDNLYNYLLRYHTTTHLTAEQIHTIGQNEMKRIKDEIIELFKDEYPQIEVEFGKTLRAISKEPRFLVGDDSDEGRQKIIDEYKRIIAEVETNLDGYFEKVPVAKCDVERVPFFKEAESAPAFYNPAPLDRSKNGIFYTNLRETESHTRIMMKDICYHEAVPGHHFQISLSQEMTSIDTFRRMMVFTAYTEGWGLYVERLADEAGWYSDKYERLGFLVAEMWRSIRLVVDTGIHSSKYKWTREHAIDIMTENTYLTEKDIVGEVERYISIPGQATAYKIGQLKIVELRERARSKLGSKFSIKAFHSVILHNGALPLTVLELLVENWIESTLKSSK